MNGCSPNMLLTMSRPDGQPLFPKSRTLPNSTETIRKAKSHTQKRGPFVGVAVFLPVQRARGKEHFPTMECLKLASCFPISTQNMTYWGLTAFFADFPSAFETGKLWH